MPFSCLKQSKVFATHHNWSIYRFKTTQFKSHCNRPTALRLPRWSLNSTGSTETLLPSMNSHTGWVTDQLDFVLWILSLSSRCRWLLFSYLSWALQSTWVFWTTSLKSWNFITTQTIHCASSRSSSKRLEWPKLLSSCKRRPSKLLS